LIFYALNWVQYLWYTFVLVYWKSNHTLSMHTKLLNTLLLLFIIIVSSSSSSSNIWNFTQTEERWKCFHPILHSKWMFEHHKSIQQKECLTWRDESCEANFCETSFCLATRSTPWSRSRWRLAPSSRPLVASQTTVRQTSKKNPENWKNDDNSIFLLLTKDFIFCLFGLEFVNKIWSIKYIRSISSYNDYFEQ
jgi:hypothetical protein